MSTLMRWNNHAQSYCGGFGINIYENPSVPEVLATPDWCLDPFKALPASTPNIQQIALLTLFPKLSFPAENKQLKFSKQLKHDSYKFTSRLWTNSENTISSPPCSSELIRSINACMFKERYALTNVVEVELNIPRITDVVDPCQVLNLVHWEDLEWPLRHSRVFVPQLQPASVVELFLAFVLISKHTWRFFSAPYPPLPQSPPFLISNPGRRVLVFPDLQPHNQTGMFMFRCLQEPSGKIPSSLRYESNLKHPLFTHAQPDMHTPIRVCFNF